MKPSHRRVERRLRKRRNGLPHSGPSASRDEGRARRSKRTDIPRRALLLDRRAAAGRLRVSVRRVVDWASCDIALRGQAYGRRRVRHGHGFRNMGPGRTSYPRNDELRRLRYQKKVNIGFLWIFSITDADDRQRTAFATFTVLGNPAAGRIM
jgi:hypothetical protein